jgi:Mn2+/Fe2+ NRAMP family transporter
VIAVSLLLGVLLVYAGFDAVSMLFWSAVVNGVLAPPLMALVLSLTNNPRVMGEHVNPPLLKWLGRAAVTVMTVAAVAMIVLSM